MKKLFISCPMKDRTKENIEESLEKMHKIAEIIFGEELEVIESYNPTLEIPEGINEPVYHLGEAIKKMAEADYFIGVNCYDDFHGCYNERRIAEDYGIKMTLVNIEDLMPDAIEIMRIGRQKMWEAETCCAVPTPV